MARVLIGVSGGIAAYKAAALVREAIKAGHSVRVLATSSASRFVGHATFEGITGAPVLVSEFDSDPLAGRFPGDQDEAGHLPIGHLELAERADLLLIAPASANTIAKLACGIADSALTTSFLACTAPKLVAPAMNDKMYENPVTQRNLDLLRERGVTVIAPETGSLASKGEYGTGRLPEPDALLAEIDRALAGTVTAVAPDTGEWRSRRVLITAGGTREPVDPVRFIGNRSSGRMGYALADAALSRGAHVTLISANVSLPPPPGAELIKVETTEQMSDACTEAFADCDLLVMAAAPADFRVDLVGTEKLRRESDGAELRLIPTPDILAGLSDRRKPGQALVGFAAEIGEGGLDRAREKLRRKGVGMIVLNDVADGTIGFDSHDNAVTLITAAGETAVPKGSKREIAEAILDSAADLARARTEAKR